MFCRHGFPERCTVGAGWETKGLSSTDPLRYATGGHYFFRTSGSSWLPLFHVFWNFVVLPFFCLPQPLPLPLPTPKHLSVPSPHSILDNTEEQAHDENAKVNHSIVPRQRRDGSRVCGAGMRSLGRAHAVSVLAGSSAATDPSTDEEFSSFTKPLSTMASF